MISSEIKIQTESEMIQSRKEGEFFFISDGIYFGLYYNSETETKGVKPQAPNFQWTPEIRF